MEAEKFHNAEYDWTYQKSAKGQLTNSICTSDYGRAGMSLWQKDQT